jgi:hypothetical protein
VFVSAMTLIERQDGHAGTSYVDLAQPYRRVVFNVLVGIGTPTCAISGSYPTKPAGGIAIRQMSKIFLAGL